MTRALLLGEIAASRRRSGGGGGGAGAYFAAVSAISTAPASHWKLDEASGNFADAFGAKTLTATGSGITYAVSTGLTGVGNGVNFGSAGWARIGSALANPGSGSFSLCGWFYLNSGYASNVQRPFLCASQVGGHVDPYYTFFYGDTGAGKYRVVVGANGGTFTPVDTSVSIISGTTWHHVAWVYDNPGDTFKIYADGSQVYTASLARTAIVATGSFAIGNISALNANSYDPDMRVAQVSYWNTYALTAGDISALFAAR